MKFLRNLTCVIQFICDQTWEQTQHKSSLACTKHAKSLISRSYFKEITDKLISSIKLLSRKPSWLGSGGKEHLSKTYLRNTGFDSQNEQRLISAHASMHESD